MTETEARQVLLLQARESVAPSALWSAEDRSWATRQAVATVGEEATPSAFVVARAVVALQRLLPRDAAGQRWLLRRGWHPAWVLLALALGFMAGLAADQLGPPQRVNLLAPAVWAVVAWNLIVYAALALPLPTLGLRQALARWGLGSHEGVTALWARHAGTLQAERAALVLHAAAAALGLGLVAGLYLRGLVLDYRAGWQSTFLDAATVQQGLSLLLAPARWATGIAVPDVVPLRVGPGGDAVASAAPWIHLYAATLALFVLLPRGLLALRAAWSARRHARHFPLPLNTPYFEALHPLMRPGLPRVLGLLWVCERSDLSLLGCALGSLAQPLTLLRSDEGDSLQLLPVPAGLDASGTRVAMPSPWWQRWRGAEADPLSRLREQVAAVLLVTAPGAPRPAWLAALGRPVVALVDDATARPPQLALQALDEGWVSDGRLIQALVTALEADPRMLRLAAAWTARQRARLDAGVAELADTLARVALARERVADVAGRGAGRAEADTARQALVAALETELQAHAQRLATLLGRAEAAEAAEGGSHGVPAAAAALHARVGEGRAALVGGVVSGALAGLKADLLSGGLTMGAGAVAGGLIGALGAAGAARGLNVVRGTEHSHVSWDETALGHVTEALLSRYMVAAHGLAPAPASERLAPALAAQQGALADLWRSRAKRAEPAEDAAPLALALRRPLTAALLQALDGPGAVGPH